MCTGASSTTPGYGRQDRRPPMFNGLFEGDPGRSHSVLVPVAGQRGYFVDDRPSVDPGFSGFAAQILKRENRVAGIAALIVDRKQKGTPPQAGRRRRRADCRVVTARPSTISCD